MKLTCKVVLYICGVLIALLCLVFLGCLYLNFEDIDDLVVAQESAVTTHIVTTTKIKITTSTLMTLTEPVTEVTTATQETTILEEEEEPETSLFEPVEEFEEECIVDTYSGLTDEEYRMLVLAVYLESGNQSYSCKEAVASVILNRLNSDEFPDTIYSVLLQEDQFTIDFSRTDTPDSDCYLAVDNVLSYGSVLPNEVKYFFADYCTDEWLWSREVYTIIDNVIFTY